MSRKFRHTFEAFDSWDNCCFEKTFVKMAARPDVDGTLTPKQLTLTSWIQLGETLSSLMKEVDKYKNAENAVTGSLCLYDGCAVIIEKWYFGDLKIKKISDQVSDGSAMIEWKLEYDSFSYTNYTNKRFSPVSCKTTELPLTMGIGKLGLGPNIIC